MKNQNPIKKVSSKQIEDFKKAHVELYGLYGDATNIDGIRYRVTKVDKEEGKIYARNGTRRIEMEVNAETLDALTSERTETGLDVVVNPTAKTKRRTHFKVR